MAITLITGAIKSGKSELAEKKALRYNNLTYVALSKPYPNDLLWQDKINIHKSRRPSNWELIENDDLFSIFKSVSGPLLIDSIGGFVVKNINKDHYEWKKNLVLHYLIIITKLKKQFNDCTSNNTCKYSNTNI